MAEFTYGYEGVTGGPQREMTIDDLLRRNSVETPAEGYTPQASIATEMSGTPATSLQEPTLMDKLKGFHQSSMDQLTGSLTGENIMKVVGSPTFANIGAQIAGPETVTGRVAGAVGGALQSQRMNEAMRKMVAQGLAGGTTNPTEGPNVSTPGLSNLDVLGLSPEQVAGLYGTATTLREKERQFPLTAMTAMGDFYNKVTTGDYHAAQVPYLRAQANKMLAETEYLPYKQALEMREKLAEIDSKLAGTEKTRAETVTERGRPAEISARTEKTREETAGLPGERRRVAAEAGKTEEQTRQLRYGLPVGVMNQQMYMKLNEQLPYNFSHDGKSLYVGNQRTGAVNVIPNGTATPDAKVTQLAWSMVSSSFLEQAKADLMAKHPGETQKAREEYEQLLFVLSKEGMTTDAQASAVRGALTPANRVKFNRAMDVYRDGEQKGWSLETMERVVQDELGQKPAAKAAPAAPSAAPAPGKPVASTAAPTKSVAGQSPKAQGFVNVAPASVESKLRKMATDAKQTLTNGRRYQDPETKEVYYYFGDKFYAK